MSGLNKVMVLGNLAADPELRQAGSTQVLRFRIGVTEKYKDKGGEWKEKTEWVSATLWGARAEALAKIMAKGERVFIEGSLHTSSYEKNGEKRYSTEVNVSNVILCGSRGKPSEVGKPAGGQAAPKADVKVSNEELANDTFGGDEDIPF